MPKLLARFDGRWLAFIGINIFAISCFMNSSMADQVGYDQLMWSQIVRAIDIDIRRQANVMSLNDCFFALAVALALSAVLILLFNKVRAGGAGAEGAH